jgi:hypothetical protein
MAARTAALMETALAKERGHRELAEPATSLAAKALVNERHRREVAECAAALAAKALADEKQRRDAAECAAALAAKTLAEKKEAAKRAWDSVAAALAAQGKRHQEEDDMTIRRIQAECALCAASLDAILADIARDDIAHEMAMLSTPPCPMTYVGAVLSTMGGSTRATSLALAPSALTSPTVNSQPSPTVDSQLQMVCRSAQPRRSTGQRARPHRRTGRCHQPHAPNPSCDEAPPSHPHPTLAGTSTPTFTPPTLSARASSTTRLGTPSLVPSSTASSTPSLLPFTFGSELLLEGLTIHSVLVARLHHHHGHTRNASPDLVTSANAMALGLPSHRTAGINIGPALPTNLLLMDWLNGGLCCFLIF